MAESSEATVEATDLVKKKNAKSIVWNYFGLKADKNGIALKEHDDHPICRTCNKSVLCKGGNTSNLFSHLRDHHPTLFKEASKGKGPSSTMPRAAATAATIGSTRSKQQETLPDAIERRKCFPSNSPQAQELNAAVAYYLAKDMQPYRTVERPGFRKLILKLNPRYQMPSRKYFSQQEIPRLYTKVKHTVVNPKLAEIEYFSATTDLWTSRATHPYLSYTVHFVDRNWDLKSFCLETVPLFDDHTGANICESIEDIMTNWQLSTDKLVVTTTDNGSNFVAAFNSTGSTRLSCFGHCLDLAIQKCLGKSEIDRALGSCNTLVAAFHRSWKKQRDLKAKQIQLGLKEHKLISSVKTRWGSTYNMIERILEQQQAVSAVLAEDRKSWHIMPTDAQFSVLEKLAIVLEPLHFLTDALAGEQEVTASAIRPILKHIEDICSLQDEDHPLTKEIKSLIIQDLSTRYESAMMSNLLDKCTFLDPRFKADFTVDKDLVVSDLQYEVRDCSNVDDLPQAESQSDTTSQSTIYTEVETPPPVKKPKGLNAVLNHILPKVQPRRESNQTMSVFQKYNKEINNYLDQPTVESDCNPLQWWKEHACVFPLLARMAKKYLCVPGTSVPSERIFSKGGLIVDPFRSRLSPGHVNTLMFLSKNIE